MSETGFLRLRGRRPRGEDRAASARCSPAWRAKYDVMNDAMSGGMHRLWKDRFVRRVKPRPGEAILDMAGGTGDIAFRLADARRRGDGGRHQPGDARRRHRAGAGARHRRPGLVAPERREAGLSRPQLRRLHDRLRHPQRDPHRRALAEAHRVLQATAGGSSASSSRPPNGRASRRPTTSIRTSWCRSIGKAIARRRGQLSLPGRIDPPLPADAASSSAMIRARRASRGPRSSRSWAGWWRSIRGGRSEPRDPPATHIWRLLKLGPHARAARRAARDRARSQHARRRCAGCARIARFGTRPAARARLRRRVPGDRPGGDQARPDARHPARPRRRGGGAQPADACRTACRRCRSTQIRARDRAQLRAAARGAVRRDRPGAGRLGLDRAGPPGGRPPTGATVAIKVLRPGIRERFARDIDTYEWAAAHLEALGGEARAAAPAADDRQLQALDQPRARPAARGGLRLRAGRRDARASKATACPRSTGTAPTAG